MARARSLLLVLLLLIAASLRAQTNVELHQALLDLSNDGVIMDLSAHPDDEDGATLAYYRMKYGVKTYSVLFTRGEGGQNERGSELYEELGAIRTQETAFAGRILGTEVFFLNFLDFGFSKTATEAIRVWGGQIEVLRRLVYLIRRLKPDILFTNHNTIDGHGHHQAVAVTAIAAFDAAADPRMFPEQLRDPAVSLWQPRKLFFRNFGGLNQRADVVNRVYDVDPVRGEAYIEIASKALREHKTQGMDRAALRSSTHSETRYLLTRVSSLFERDTTTFFGGYDLWHDTSLTPLRPLRGILSHWSEATPRDTLLRQASAALTSIAKMLPQSHSPLARRVLDGWQEKIERLISASCGLTATLVLSDSLLVPGQTTDARISLHSRDCQVAAPRVMFQLPEGWSVQRRQTGGGSGTSEQQFAITVGRKPLLTLPRAVEQYHFFTSEARLAARVTLSLDGYPVSTLATVRYDVAPPRVLDALPRRVRLDPAAAAHPVVVRWRLKNYGPQSVRGQVRMRMPGGWRATPVTYSVAVEDGSDSGTVVVQPPRHVAAGEYTLYLEDGVTADSVMVSAFHVALAPDINLGIIASYDTTIEAVAHEMGLTHELVSDANLQQGNLTRFNSIVVDIRAYLVRKALRDNYRRLLDYVAQGGNLVVMYQKTEEWDSVFAPYPFQITHRRIVDENAPVTPLVPDHPLLNLPNKITGMDWSGWKQERGLYFPGEVPPVYTRLVAMADAYEEPLTTGYIVAPFGKGSYIYTSLVWYRELGELNPGAFHSFANMISYFAFREKRP